MPALARATLTALLAGVLAAGCAAGGGQQARPGSDDKAQTALTRAATTNATKLLVVVEENHSLAQMRAGMPYTFGLAKRYGYATQYHAIRHPSLPNYIAIASGNTHGVVDDRPPSEHRLRGATVFQAGLQRQRRTAVYAQSMPRRCATTSQGPYAVKHNPWAYFPGQRRQCRGHNFSMRHFGPDVRNGRLPRVGMVVPDLNHDAHDGTLRTADRWFKNLMSQVTAGPDWKSGHLVVVLTADEDDGSQGNRVLTVVVHPSQRHHVVRRSLNHYSLTRLYSEVAGLPRIGQASSAPSMARAFGLPVP